MTTPPDDFRQFVDRLEDERMEQARYLRLFVNNLRKQSPTELIEGFAKKLDHKGVITSELTKAIPHVQKFLRKCAAELPPENLKLLTGIKEEITKVWTGEPTPKAHRPRRKPRAKKKSPTRPRSKKASS